jgi:N-acetylglutamate synthase-like GNAT family acetyltransferase
MAFKIAQEKILHDSERFYIREAKPGEVDALHAIFRETLGSGYTEPKGDRLTLIAVDKETNKVIGGDDIEINLRLGTASGGGLVVLPQYRKQGVGKALSKVMGEELRKMNVVEIVVFQKDNDARKFFEKMGLEDAMLMGGEAVMKKELWKKPKQA